jgi:hypothetical protein
MEKLSALRTGLGTLETQPKTTIDQAKHHARLTTKNQTKNSLYPHSHFTEHLIDAFKKSPRKNDLNYELSSLLNR